MAKPGRVVLDSVWYATAFSIHALILHPIFLCFLLRGTLFSAECLVVIAGLICRLNLVFDFCFKLQFRFLTAWLAPVSNVALTLPSIDSRLARLVLVQSPSIHFARFMDFMLRSAFELTRQAGFQITNGLTVKSEFKRLYLTVTV